MPCADTPFLPFFLQLCVVPLPSRRSWHGGSWQGCAGRVDKGMFSLSCAKHKCAARQCTHSRTCYLCIGLGLTRQQAGLFSNDLVFPCRATSLYLADSAPKGSMMCEWVTTNACWLHADRVQGCCLAQVLHDCYTDSWQGGISGQAATQLQTPCTAFVKAPHGVVKGMHAYCAATCTRRVKSGVLHKYGSDRQCHLMIKIHHTPYTPWAR